MVSFTLVMNLFYLINKGVLGDVWTLFNMSEQGIKDQF